MDSACKVFQPIFSSPPLSPPQSHRCRRSVGEESGEQEEEKGAALEQEQEWAGIGGKGGTGSSYFFTLTSLTPSQAWTDHFLFL